MVVIIFQKFFKGVSMFFCKHDWVVIDKTVSESPIEYIDRTSCPENLEHRNRTVPYWMFSKTVITICRCSRCGRIKKFVTKISAY